MHDGVWWFDTAACWKGGFIGEINSVETSISAIGNTWNAVDANVPGPTTTGTTNLAWSLLDGSIGDTWGAGSWWAGANYANTEPEKDYKGDWVFNKLVPNTNSNAA